MTTAEISALSSEFQRRADTAKLEGNTEARIAWEQAAALLLHAEGNAIIAAFDRSQRRRAAEAAKHQHA